MSPRPHVSSRRKPSKRFSKAAAWVACVGSLVTAAPAFADQVTLADLPPAAKQAVEHETKGGTITEIEKDHKGGKPVYDVEYTKDGMKREVKVSETGAILERKKD